MTIRFPSPVWIHERGLDFRSIDSVEEAYSYLKGWRGDRGAIYDHALVTLGGGLNGQVTARRAHEVFRQFAKSGGVLAEADAA